MYFSDTSNNRVRKVTIPTGIISTVVGTGSASYSGDNGVATSATLNLPHSITFDAAGNLNIADALNQRIRKVDTSSIITTIAGSSTSGSYNGVVYTTSCAFRGDGGQASSAALNTPYGVALDSSGATFSCFTFFNFILILHYFDFS